MPMYPGSNHHADRDSAFIAFRDEHINDVLIDCARLFHDGTFVFSVDEDEFIERMRTAFDTCRAYVENRAKIEPFLGE